MTLSQFSVASGASPKWVQNAARLLGRSLRYTAEEARHLGLVRQIHRELRIPLELADELAAEALGRPETEARGEVTVGSGPTVRVVVDLARYLSDHSVRLSLAIAHHEPRRRGRQPRHGAGAVARARDYGWDIGLLESSLRSTPADRIRRLSENMEFVRALRAG
jgi:hypothetical protein